MEPIGFFFFYRMAPRPYPRADVCSVAGGSLVMGAGWGAVSGGLWVVGGWFVVDSLVGGWLVVCVSG